MPVHRSNAAPGTINPPGSVRLRRQGASAECVCPRRDDKPLDTAHDLLGVEYFTPEPELETARLAVKAGHAVHHDEKVVRAIMRASEFLIFGCPSV